MDISVIIVSYNVRYYLRQCIESVKASARAGKLDVEIFVVDNHSKDNSIGYLRATFPENKHRDLHFIANQRNVGFGRANNQALKKAKGKYILFLNPDTIITETTLRDCFDFAETKSQFGGLGVKMLSSAGEFSLESRRGLPTPWVAFCKMSGLASCFPKSRVFGKYYLRYLDENAPAEIEIISGAYMFCSQSALKQCGGFDEKFFMYGEDIDLSYRLLLGGFHNWYYPTPIVHYKGESTYKGSYKYVHTFYEAMLIFFQKHFPKASYALSVPVKTAIIGRACLELMRQQMRSFLHFLNPASDHVSMDVTYYGPQQTHEELLLSADQWGITFKCTDDLNDAVDSKSTFVAYDAETYSFSEILRQLMEKRRFLCMYYPSRHTLITGADIYKK